jgi:hypothetical protein
LQRRAPETVLFGYFGIHTKPWRKPTGLALKISEEFTVPLSHSQNAAIYARADGPQTATSRPGKICLATTPDGKGGDPIDRLYLRLLARTHKGTGPRTDCGSNRTSDGSACHATQSSPAQSCLGVCAACEGEHKDNCN